MDRPSAPLLDDVVFLVGTLDPGEPSAGIQGREKLWHALKDGIDRAILPADHWGQGAKKKRPP